MSTRDLKTDYLNGAPELAPFHRHPYPMQDYGPLFAGRDDFAVDRELLVHVLRQQNQDQEGAAETLANIELLRQDRTYTVATGHQLVLMGGPMYMLYKIATTIQLARTISAKHPDRKVVPVFWMASEDHDWQEVNHFHAGYGEKVTYPGYFTGPVGRHVLEDSIADTLSSLPAGWREVYQPGETLSQAFRKLIARLFKGQGLIILDADDPQLKQSFLPWMRAELEDRGMGEYVAASSQALEAAGYPAQVYPREINLFYMGEGPRQLIFQEGDRFVSKDGQASWSREELQALLEARPADFSPNAAMRPLYQEVILPNLAYIGGWAEVSYWHQLMGAFEAARVPFPLLVPRMSASLIGAEQAARLEELNLRPEDLDLLQHELFDRYLSQLWTPDQLHQHFAQLNKAFSDLANYIDELDPPLADSVRADHARAEKSLNNLEKKLKRSIRKRHPQAFGTLEEVQNQVQPQHKKQERILNFTHFADSEAGWLVELILSECHPENFAPQWITLPAKRN